MRKGIILAGGNGSRLSPITNAISKQLVPVYDKPLIYYPLSCLIMAGIKEILIISSALHLPSFKRLFGTGAHLGLELHYEVQDKPNGIGEAYIIGESFLNEEPSALILGDNIFYGNDLKEKFKTASKNMDINTIITHHVAKPERYGVMSLDNKEKIIDIIEKPISPPSPYAITGFYFLDEYAVKHAKQLTVSKRGELEITELLKKYLRSNNLRDVRLGRGSVWFDAGTVESLLDASNFIQSIKHRHGLMISCPEELAYREGLVNLQQLTNLANSQSNPDIKNYLLKIVEVDTV
jgi:glucose-1-phosphate thymidylyltransferase